MADTKFIDGLMAKKPREKAPDFVICDISIKREELIATLQGMEGEWINGNVLETKAKDKYYVALNDYKPKKQGSGNSQPAADEGFDEDIPF